MSNDEALKVGLCAKRVKSFIYNYNMILVIPIRLMSTVTSWPDITNLNKIK